MITKVTRYLSWLIPIIIGLVIALLIRQFWFTMVKVDGDSMQPNLQNNEHVVAVKTSKVKRGNVIVFHAYGVDATEKDRNAVYVKRVVAVGGDTVRYTHAGKLYVNNKLVKQSYQPSRYQLTTGSYMANSHSQFTGWTLNSLSHDQPAWQVKVTNNRVPKGSYFVLGDHRSVSNDGRSWGFVPQSKVIGIVKAWPWQNRKQYINNYQP
ncbi:signal peptidase I [Lactiplantibacillus pentosus]|uniref:signal peptidase I n=1 Tax=Lactiplantibacillus pentosus TaxID=1589 RepID=UPI000EA8D59D|nr:signal peptidase I [Lactiplantibacillus pentosus]AYG38226.1 signal peptidase I [Lactiplantibacillus pentosus]AYG40884.1 signal peptidase I [Lactiplantibacillus pentosus]